MAAQGAAFEVERGLQGLQPDGLAPVGLAQADARFVGALAADDGDRGGFFNIGGNAHVAIGPLQGGVQLGLGAAGVDVPAALQAQVAADAGALQNGVVRGEVVGPGQGQAAEFARAHHAPGGGVQCQGGPAHLGLLGLVFGGGGGQLQGPGAGLDVWPGLPDGDGSFKGQAPIAAFCAGAGQQREGLRLQLPAAWGVPLGLPLGVDVRLLAALVELALQMGGQLF